MSCKLLLSLRMFIWQVLSCPQALRVLRVNENLNANDKDRSFSPEILHSMSVSGISDLLKARVMIECNKDNVASPQFMHSESSEKDSPGKLLINFESIEDNPACGKVLDLESSGEDFACGQTLDSENNDCDWFASLWGQCRRSSVKEK